MDKQDLARNLQVYQQCIEQNMRAYTDLLEAQFELMQKLAVLTKYERWLVLWRELLRQL